MSRYLDTSTKAQMAKTMHGLAWKIQSFLLSEIFTLVFQQDYCGKDNSRKFYWNTVGTKFQIGNVHSLTEKKGTILVCVCGRHKKLAGKKQNINPIWIILMTKKLIWEIQHLSLIMYTWAALKMWNKQRYCGQLQNHVWIQNFSRSNWKTTMLGKSADLFMVLWHGKSCQIMPKLQKSFQVQRNLMQAFLHGAMMWKVRQRNAWSDIVSWQTRRLNNSTKYLLHASMTIISKKKNWNPWGNCQKYALKLFWNAFSWHVLEDLIFYGQWTNLHDRSQNGPKHVTNAWIDWYLTFTTHVNRNSIAMWVILHNNAGWDCFKTPILQEILRMQNLHQVEHCAFLEVERLFQSVGCVRSKLQFRTVQQSQKSFLWMQVYAWMGYSRSIFGIWLLKCVIPHQNKPTKPKMWEPRGDPLSMKRIKDLKEWPTCWITFIQTVLQSLKSFLWMHHWGWTVYLHLIYGIWSPQFFTETRIRVIKNGETCARTFVQHLTNFKNERNLEEWSMIWTMLILFSPNVNSSRQEALLYVFKDNEAVNKMIMKKRSPTMRHVSRTHRVALGWLFGRINLDPKIQIKYIDTKNQLADILTKGNFTRDKWNHLLCLFNISHFSSTKCLEVMSKRTQEDLGEERVTAKSKPMMNLVSRYRVRDPNVLASTASESPGNTRYERQIPLSSWTEQQPRTGRLVSEQPAGLFTQHTCKFVIDDDDMDSDTVTESNLSLKSRSFLKRVNDRVRKILDQSSKDAMQDGKKHSVIWWMFTSTTLEASVLMGKNYSEILHSIKNTGNNLTILRNGEQNDSTVIQSCHTMHWRPPIEGRRNRVCWRIV